MKKAARTASLMMVLLMLAGLFAGCGAQRDATAEAGESTGGAQAGTGAEAGGDGSGEEPLSFSVMTVNFGEEPTGKPVEEAWIAEMEELMGRKLDIKFQYVAMADYAEKLKIMLASGELPDLITLAWGATQADITKYGDNGIFVELTQYMDRLPNYKKYLDQAPSSAGNAYTEEGKLYCFYSIQTGWQEYSGGSNQIATAAAFREDIFEENNIPLPLTVEDVYNAAKKLKEIYPDKYPIMQMEEWEPPINMLMAANHIGGSYSNGGFDGLYYDGTTAQYGPIQEGYKDALIEMNKWYTEGLISPEYFTQTSADGNAAMAAGDGMIIPSCYYGYPGYWSTIYPEQKWALATEVKNPKYGDPWTYYMGSLDDVRVINGYGIAINAKSKVVDELLDFMNCYFADSVVDLFSWGIEGLTYTETDGEKHMVTANSGEFDSYAYGQGTCRAGIFPQAYSMVPSLDASSSQDFVKADGTITSTIVPFYVKENFKAERSQPAALFITETMNPDKSEEKANIMTPVNTYAAEQMAAFITGSRSFDEWDAYVEEVKAMGDIDRAIELENSLQREKKDF